MLRSKVLKMNSKGLGTTYEKGEIMTPTIGTEKPAVQDPIIKYADEIDWKVVPWAIMRFPRNNQTGGGCLRE